MGSPTEEWTLKAPAADQLRLLELQDIDTKLDQLDHRERSLPESIAIAELDARLSLLDTDIVTAQTEVTDLSRAVSRAEDEVQAVRSRATKDQQLLDSGAITSPKQLSELQHEITSLARRQGELEDAELEVMELLEQAQGAVAELTATVQGIDGQRQELSAARDLAMADISRERALAVGQRSMVSVTIPADLIALYEKLRADQGGVGAAALRRNRCEGCHMQLPPTELESVLSAAPDEVVRCEECRRILIRVSGTSPERR
ncbi:MAG: C4-type zinc ribbon domain-containing protein [Actinomycetes bacterium]